MRTGINSQITLPSFLSLMPGMLCLAIVMLTISCKHEMMENSPAYKLNQPTSDYVVEPKEIDVNDVHVTLGVESYLEQGELILIMNVKNNRDENIHVDYMNCALRIDDERTAVPRVLNQFKTTLPDGDEEEYKISFRPINTLDVYNSTGYYGDMKQQYSVDLNFLTDANGRELCKTRVNIRLPDKAYQLYNYRYAREKWMTLFNFAFDQQDFEWEEARYLAQLNAKRQSSDDTDGKPVISALNPSITINRMMVNIFTYQEKDTLIVNMRMLNQDSLPLKIIPAKCRVFFSNHEHAPVAISSDSFESNHFPDSTYIFKPGTRLHLKLKYRMMTTVDRWLLSRDWMLIRQDKHHDKWFHLLFDDVPFRQSAAASVL